MGKRTERAHRCACCGGEVALVEANARCDRLLAIIDSVNVLNEALAVANGRLTALLERKSN